MTHEIYFIVMKGWPYVNSTEMGIDRRCCSENPSPSISTDDEVRKTRQKLGNDRSNRGIPLELFEYFRVPPFSPRLHLTRNAWISCLSFQWSLGSDLN